MKLQEWSLFTLYCGHSQIKSLKIEVSMFSWVEKLIFWIKSLWISIPESTKDRVMETIVESFTEIFRQFYREKKGKGEADNGNV